ncbi:aminopeptidase P family protein [soil metagenome]
MRHQPIPAALFAKNRKALGEKMLPASLAILNANDIPPTNADGSTIPVPNADLFYLSGIEQEETILVLAPDAIDPRMREILFLREPNEHLKVWEGHKHPKEEARSISGIREIKWLTEFPALLHKLMCEMEHVYVNTNEHSRAAIQVETREARFVSDLRQKYPAHDFRRLARPMHELRAVKSETELSLIRRACGITRGGFLRVLGMVRPGVMEFEVEAEFSHEFIRNRARFAYNPIIASGANACTLHYNQNDQPCRDRELLLLDVAASYGNYQSDLTRTIPVNRRFTRRQRQVYDAVLRALRAVTKAIVPGKLHLDWQKESERIVEEELLQLGLLKSRDIKRQDPDNPALKKYFMHGIGHPMGLDVHDVALLNQPFAPGWVLTVEPGIYIPEEGFAVRLENDVLLTEKGPVDLMADIPIEAEEIEELMNKRGKRRPVLAARRKNIR